MIIKTDKNDIYVIQAENKVNQDVSSALPARPLNNKPLTKYVIAGVIVVTVVVMLVIGAVVTVHLITDSKERTIRYDRRFRSGDMLVEDTLTTDSYSNNPMRLHYHLQNVSDETWGIVDYTRGMVVVKVKSDPSEFESEFECLVTFGVNASRPSDSPRDGEQMTTTSVRFKISDKPIDGISSLFGDYEKELCSGIPVYRIDEVPAESGTSVSAGSETEIHELSRKKRRWICSRSYVSCRVIYYFEDRSRRFYRCGRICVYSVAQP